MIDLKKYRLIDLSVEMIPGERKIDGRYLHGVAPDGRPVEVQEFIAFEARMHFIQGHTHSGGTHVEAPYKYADDGADIADMPLQSYIGQAVACNFTQKKALEPIDVDDLKRCGIAGGDIVLIWAGGDTAQKAPYLTVAAVDWLIEMKIKSLGFEFIDLAPPKTPYGLTGGDAKLLLAGISLLDGLIGLNQIRKQRVFVIALPIRMKRVTASWARAIALEEIDS